jgi:hypothetical protein
LLGYTRAFIEWDLYFANVGKRPVKRPAHLASL